MAGHAVSDHPLRLAASAGTGIRCHVLLVHPRRTDTAHHKLYLAEELDEGMTGTDPSEAPEFPTGRVKDAHPRKGGVTRSVNAEHPEDPGQMWMNTPHFTPKPGQSQSNHPTLSNQFDQAIPTKPHKPSQPTRSIQTFGSPLSITNSMMNRCGQTRWPSLSADADLDLQRIVSAKDV